jgi:hypothetical protein
VDKELKVQLARQVLMDQQVLKVLKEELVLKDLKVLQEELVLKELKVLKEPQVLKEVLLQMVL